jgi:hypothetical protein
MAFGLPVMQVDIPAMRNALRLIASIQGLRAAIADELV